LHELVLCPADRYSEGLEVVCQLTGLRRLHVADFQPDGLLMHLSQLRQLTHLEYLSYSYMDGGFYTVQCKVQVGGFLVSCYGVVVLASSAVALMVL
jgi:hypothetical protein